jgi:hypothetical protein
MTADKNFKRLVRDRTRQTNESYTTARRQLLRTRTEEHMTTPTNQEDRLVEVDIEGVKELDIEDVQAGSVTRAMSVQLRDVRGRRLSIVIGRPEAQAIALAIQQVPHARPMTHDALREAISAFDAQLLRIVIGFLPNMNTFTADVVLATPDGDERHLDWRPSDSIALAVRCDPRPSILVPESMLADPPTNIAVGATPQSGRMLVCGSCGAWIPVDEGPNLTHVDCPSCGRRQRLPANPTTGQSR